MSHDQTTDRSFRVFASKLRDFGDDARELIKQASIDYDEFDSLPETAFAWPEERRYPLHTKEQAALSIVYASGESLPKYVTDNLEKAAELYEIEIQPLEKKAHEVVDDIEDYLIPQQRFGHITDSDTVKQAAEFYRNNWKRMDLATRTHAAEILVKKAEAFHEDLPADIYQRAGRTEVNLDKLAEWIEVRANMTEDQDVKEAFSKLASFVGDKKEFRHATRDDMVKVASTIATLDRKAGLTARYDIKIPDAVVTVFNTTKIAEETLTLAGKQVPLTKLFGIPAETYGDILGEDIVSEIADGPGGDVKHDELMAVLKSLPADLQVVLVRTLKL